MSATWFRAATACVVLALGSTAQAQRPPPGPVAPGMPPVPTAPPKPPTGPAPAPQMKNLGGERYRIGSILVDRKKARLTVPGELIRNTGPLEYLAVTKGGYKRYESMLEVETTGSEFNLACILLGLDAELTKRPQYQFATEPLSGQRVAFQVEWKDAGGKVRRAAPMEMLLTDEQRAKGVPDEWVYTGSVVGASGIFLADSVGSLIGLVHDPASVVEHVTGVGIGAYGSVAGNEAVLPPLGTRVTLTMTVLEQGRAR